MALINLALFKAADPFARLLSRPAERWKRDGVIRGPAMFKVWQDDSPRRFSSFVSIYQGMSVLWWLVLKGFGVLLGVIAIGMFVVRSVAG